MSSAPRSALAAALAWASLVAGASALTTALWLRAAPPTLPPPREPTASERARDQELIRLHRACATLTLDVHRLEGWMPGEGPAPATFSGEPVNQRDLGQRVMALGDRIRSLEEAVGPRFGLLISDRGPLWDEVFTGVACRQVIRDPSSEIAMRAAAFHSLSQMEGAIVQLADLLPEWNQCWLEASEPRDQYRLAFTLADMPESEATVAAVVHVARTSPDPRLREVVLEQLRRYTDSPLAESAYAAGLQDPDPEVRDAAREAYVRDRGRRR